MRVNDLVRSHVFTGSRGAGPHIVEGLVRSAAQDLRVAVSARLLTAVSEMQLIYAELSRPFLECQKKGKGGKGLSSEINFLLCLLDPLRNPLRPAHATEVKGKAPP